MNEERPRRRGKQAPGRKSPAKAGKKRAVKVATRAPTRPAAKAGRKRKPAVMREAERELEPTAAVRELDPVEWARDAAELTPIDMSMADLTGPDEHPGYLTTGARRLARRMMRAALAPLSLARAVLIRLRDRS